MSTVHEIVCVIGTSKFQVATNIQKFGLSIHNSNQSPEPYTSQENYILSGPRGQAVKSAVS